MKRTPKWLADMGTRLGEEDMNTIMKNLKLSDKQIISMVDFLSGRFQYVSNGWYKDNRESVIEDTFKFVETLTKHN